jgi:hypothetical protein
MKLTHFFHSHQSYVWLTALLLIYMRPSHQLITCNKTPILNTQPRSDAPELQWTTAVISFLWKLVSYYGGRPALLRRAGQIGGMWDQTTVSHYFCIYVTRRGGFELRGSCLRTSKTIGSVSPPLVLPRRENVLLNMLCCC